MDNKFDEGITINVFRNNRPAQTGSSDMTILSVHPEEWRPIFFRPINETQYFNRTEFSYKSPLQAWFKLNQTCASARVYSFNEIPLHYEFIGDPNYIWRLRDKSRFDLIVEVKPVAFERNPEMFAIRQLVLHQKGPCSFQQLRTVGDFVYSTSFEAARALNLI